MEKTKETPDQPEADQAPPTPSGQEAVDMVFRNHLLRENILEHVLYPSDGVINYADVGNVRRVQKSWLISTSEVLRRKGDPLYRSTNFATKARRKLCRAEEHQVLNKFVNTINHRIESVIPPIRLQLFTRAFFVPETQEALSNFLVSCGPGLTSLDMVVPKSCSSLFLFPRFSLPNLQHLRIIFVPRSRFDVYTANPIELRVLREKFAVTYFVQRILDSTRSLEKLEFSASMMSGSDIIPSGLDLLRLPKSVKTLLVKCPLLVEHLEMLSPSNDKAMPAHLTKLEITSSEIPFPQNTIHGILLRHCGTLKEIKLGGKTCRSVKINHPSPFKMPDSIKNLQKITLASPSWLYENKFYMNTPRNYPNLTTFNMERVSVALFNQITDRYRTNFETVKNLKIWLVRDQDAVNHFQMAITLDLEKMRRAHLAFSCVSNLDITVCGKEICGLRYIFKEMGQLNSLAINVEIVNGNDMTCEAWDGLFIGAPEKIAKSLRKRKLFWTWLSLNSFDDYPSIQKLKALSTFTLDTSNITRYYGLVNETRGLLSQVSFLYAFLKMERLKTLNLFGRFQPNEEMINLWKEQKKDGSLVYGWIRRMTD